MVLLVGLPSCEIRVINIAIFWNSLVLIGTLKSKNPVSYTQSAGNLYTKGLRSSSETICETSRNFELFNKLSRTQISSHWLSWFIGFSEGDGSLITSKFGVPCFVITQKEPDILYSIRNKLGFGETKYDKSANCYRYVVRDLTSIIKLIFIFKGNLFLDHRINQLNNWILAIKQRQVIPSQQFSELEYKIWVQELLLLNTADSISRVNCSHL